MFYESVWMLEVLLSQVLCSVHINIWLMMSCLLDLLNSFIHYRKYCCLLIPSITSLNKHKFDDIS